MYKENTQVTIGKETYTVNYPTVGQKLAIESAKQALSKGTYRELAQSGHDSASDLLDLIDAFAYFGVLIPKLELTLAKFETVSPVDAKRYVNAFRKYFVYVLEVDREIEKDVTEPNNATA